MPIEPPSTPWVFPEADAWPVWDFVAAGADLEPGTLLAAYRRGLFPMPLDAAPDAAPETWGEDAADDMGGEPVNDLGWWSPDPRGVLPLEGLKVSRSLRRSCRRYEIRVDTAFGEVMRACADPDRDGSWIEPGFVAAYTALHERGWAHSVETWSDGELVGGLYGVAIGGLFAGESMFHRERDASKAALVGLVSLLREAGGDRLLDVQWSTPHLASLGVVEIARSSYLRRLDAALLLPDAFTAAPTPAAPKPAAPTPAP